MRLRSHPQEPCPKLRKWVGEAGSGPGRTVREGPGLSQHSHLQLESWCQGQPGEAPAISPCVCQAPKTPSPNCLPACLPVRLPAMELPECLQLSLPLNLPLGPSSCWLWEAGVHSPSVVAGMITTPQNGQRSSHPGSAGLFTEEKCTPCTGGTARSVGRWEPETIS